MLNDIATLDGQINSLNGAVQKQQDAFKNQAQSLTALSQKLAAAEAANNAANVGVGESSEQACQRAD